MKKAGLIFLCALPLFCFCQCKIYKIGIKGDTLNCIDNKNLKQGKWIIHVDALRGEPGFEAEGEFKDDKKIGTWRNYSLQGDLLAIENFRWGNKDGICDYYNLNGLEHEESWKAIDPKNPYDTVKVYDINEPGKYAFKVVKVEATSVKQGTWTYYNTDNGTIIKQEDYVLDQIVDPVTGMPFNNNAVDSSATAQQDTSKAKPTPEMLQYEKQNQKKKIKVRDGATGL